MDLMSQTALMSKVIPYKLSLYDIFLFGEIPLCSGNTHPVRRILYTWTAQAGN